MTYSLQALGQYKASGAASALKQRDYKDATDLTIQKGGDSMTSVVRRLTPRE